MSFGEKRPGRANRPLGFQRKSGAMAERSALAGLPEVQKAAETVCIGQNGGGLNPDIQRSPGTCLDSLGPSPSGTSRHGSRCLKLALQLGNARHSRPYRKLGDRRVTSVFLWPQRLPRPGPRLMGVPASKAGNRRTKTPPFPITQRANAAFDGIEDLTDGIVRHLLGGFRRKFRRRVAKGFAQRNKTRRIRHGASIA